MMELEELVTRAERMGILTTAKGRRKMICPHAGKIFQGDKRCPGRDSFRRAAKTLSKFLTLPFSTHQCPPATD